MTPPPDDHEATRRQRTRDQFGLLRDAHGADLRADTSDPADFSFLYDPRHVLIPSPPGPLSPPPPPGGPPDDAYDRLADYFNVTRNGEFEPVPTRSLLDPPDPLALPLPAEAEVDPGPGPAELTQRFALPARSNRAPLGEDDFLAIMDDLDREFGVGYARPDHYVHICPKGSLCPATEPDETGPVGPWPPVNTTDPDAGLGVRVLVVDTGWYDPTTDATIAAAGQAFAPGGPWSWLHDPGVDPASETEDVWEHGHDGVTVLPSAERPLKAYAGHGTFVAGIIRAMAPRCDIKILSILVDVRQPGGGVRESDLTNALYSRLRPVDDALEPITDTFPHLINISAGCPTRLDQPARAFEDWYAAVQALPTVPDFVTVAAAGNNGTAAPFWPASFDWALGVGSVDRDGSRSDFSNHGDSADVFALGRNVINAFPNGTYRCHEAPDRGDTRVFTNWLARWSGTSFAAPVVTGLLAAAMSRQTGERSAQRARADLLSAGGASLPVLREVQVPLLGEGLISPPHS